VLVHCGAGVSRSASLVAAYLIQSGACESAEDAVSYCRKRRSCVAPNEGFLAALVAFAASQRPGDAATAAEQAQASAQASARAAADALLADVADARGGNAIAGWDDDEEDAPAAPAAAPVAAPQRIVAVAAPAPLAASAPPGDGAAWLDVLKEGALLARVPLPRGVGGELTFGRLPGCGVVLDHPSISRLHARLTRTAAGNPGSCWALADEGSAHGTWVGAARVAPRGAPVALADGAVMRFGGSTRRYVFRAGTAAAAVDVAAADVAPAAEAEAVRGVRERSRSRESGERERKKHKREKKGKQEKKEKKEKRATGERSRSRSRSRSP
jgi:dual specificity MAP kinase phosphatase